LIGDIEGSTRALVIGKRCLACLLHAGFAAQILTYSCQDASCDFFGRIYNTLSNIFSGFGHCGNILLFLQSLLIHFYKFHEDFLAGMIILFQLFLNLPLDVLRVEKRRNIQRHPSLYRHTLDSIT